MDTIENSGAVSRKRAQQHAHASPPASYGGSPSTGRGGRKETTKKEGNSNDSLLLIFAFMIPMILFEITGNPLVYLYRKVHSSTQNNSITENQALLRATATPIPAGTRGVAEVPKTSPPFIPNQPVTWVTAPPLPGSTSVDPYKGRKGSGDDKTEKSNRPLESSPVQNTHQEPLRDDQKVVAYVVPIWRCKLIRDTIVDAALVLRHSIHQQSKRNHRPSSGSRSTWDYQMYAMISGNLDVCQAPALEALGYTILQPGTPLHHDEISSDTLRQYMGDIPDGGPAQFHQLLAHTLVAPHHVLVVTMYLQTLLQKPLDDLFHGIASPVPSPEGVAARQKIQSLQERPSDPLPDRIHHFLVRDYPHTGYGRKPVAMTPGFIVSRRDPEVATLGFSVIHSGSYKDGNDQQSGWGGKGYTDYWRGGMGIAGFYPYLMETFFPKAGVELKGCLFHHNGMDNKLRNVPRFHMAEQHGGACRSGEAECEDCTTTSVDSMYSILYDHTCKHS